MKSPSVKQTQKNDNQTGDSMWPLKNNYWRMKLREILSVIGILVAIIIVILFYQP